MGKYEKDRKFYWLQLKEDFFDEDAISWLEEQENGEKYSLFYLKLCLKSLKTKGILIRQVGNMLVPYDRNKLAEITRTDPDTVTIAMKLLEQIGLIKIMENGEIYLTQIEALIGAKSIGAFKKEQQRLLKGRQEEDKCPPLCPPEIELDIELDIDIELELKKVVEFFNKNFYEISDEEKNIFLSYIKSNFNSELIIYAMTLAIKQNKKTMAYVEGILEKWKEMKIDTVEKAKKAQEDYKKQKEEKSSSNSYKNYDQRDCKNLDDFLINKTWEEKRMKKDVNIEEYLSSTRYTTRKELCEKTNLCDREVRQRISELKKTRVVIFSSGGKGYRLAKEYKSMSRVERDEELNQIRRSLNECKSRTSQINKQKRKYIAYLKKAEEIEREELERENEKHYTS